MRANNNLSNEIISNLLSGKLAVNNAINANNSMNASDAEKVDGFEPGEISSLAMANSTTIFNEDGSISETIENGTKTTIFNEDGSITETVVINGITTTKTTVFNEDGSIVATVV